MRLLLLIRNRRKNVLPEFERLEPLFSVDKKLAVMPFHAI
mgnify:CR=1 FL=1